MSRIRLLIIIIIIIIKSYYGAPEPMLRSASQHNTNYDYENHKIHRNEKVSGHNVSQ